MTIRVEYLPLSQIQTWDRNPKDHDIGAIHQSMARFGYVSPVLLNEASSRLVAGHGRLETLAQIKAQGASPPEGITVGDDGDWLVPVIRGVSFEDEAEAEAYGVADNRLVALGGWDDAKLAEVLGELATGADLGLEGTGYDTDDLDELLSRLGSDYEDPDVDEAGIDTPEGADDLPDQVEALTKAGDVVQIGRHTLHCGDCIEVMRGLPDCSVDAIVTDPPYGIGFMGKGWDCAVPGDDFASEAYRILRPGGHIIAFAATRTIHRLTVALEDAGLDIRDQIAHLQYQGFPKSHDASKALDAHFGAEREVVGSYEVTRDISGGSWADLHGKANGATMHSITAPATPEAQQWQGWGTALKPAIELCILARKPLEGTVAENLIKWGVGGLNIDGCRYPPGDPAWPGPHEARRATGPGLGGAVNTWNAAENTDRPENLLPWGVHAKGRWPSNIYHCPKASRSEREQGCDDLPTVTGAQAVCRKSGTKGASHPRAGAGRERVYSPDAEFHDGPGGPGRAAREDYTYKPKTVHNNHPTVKPVRLMQWLVRLVSPEGCTVLEPFAGSGTTLLACELEGVSCVGIEMAPEYCDIIRARLTHWTDRG